MKSSTTLVAVARQISTGLLASLLFLAGCGEPAPVSDVQPATGCIEDYDPQRDYFPDKIDIEYAENFSLEYRDSYKLVTVRRPKEGGVQETYVLLLCGAPAPVLDGDLASAPVISIPIQSMFSDSATHIPLLVDLGRIDVLTGAGQTRFITTEPALERVRQGHVTEYAPNNVIDTELVVSKAPAILMSSGGFSDAYHVIRRGGIAVVTNAEWQEASALGRAEWVKYMSLYLNEEARAERVFDTLRDRYMELRQRTQSIPDTDRPRIMTGLANRGMFEISGGRSYVATMIHDAGGLYIWADNSSSGFATIDMESQIARAFDADFWINGGDWTSLQGMLMEEKRYKEFKAFQKGNVWMYNRAVNPEGGNDYWTRGSTRPDLILADLIKIFHPDLATDHEFVFYKRVTER